MYVPFIKRNIFVIRSVLVVTLALSCTAGPETGEEIPPGVDTLNAIAESERAEGYRPGLGLVESAVREQRGDHAGAVIAAFKDLCWAYSLDTSGIISSALIREGLAQVRELYTTPGVKDVSESQRSGAIAAVDSALNFIDGNYAQAGALLRETFPDEEPDSFVCWMRLVCALEEGGTSDTLEAAYTAIRARYEFFPAYWYHGARKLPWYLAAEYAERCINIEPNGVYSNEARIILARF